MSVSCTLLDLDTDFVLNLPEVMTAKEQIDQQTRGSIYFTVQLTPSIRRVLTENWNLNCSSIDTVPMRWIKGDTHPHIDKGTHSFDTTYLAYLTDSPGNLMIDGKAYPIAKRNAYIFSEGLSHETIETGTVPRLLLGPMSENGISVGGTDINADGQFDTIYINYTTVDGLRYKINSGYNHVFYSATIQNTNTAYPLKVLFETDITINGIFKCATGNIQFGSESLNGDGTRPVITINDAPDYLGLINNGYFNVDGFNAIYVYNIKVETSGTTTLAVGGGWIGQSYFGNGASNNYIVNCSSTGDIPDAVTEAGGGGIVGTTEPSELLLIGCSSTGLIGENCGGIAGQINGSVTCQYCWSEGNIGVSGGGIYSASAQVETVATNCYSLGNIGIGGGGIYGSYAGDKDGNALATNCYSIGNIDASGGGIFGSFAAYNNGSTLAENCYSIGTWTGGTRGIYGADEAVTATFTNCYSANGTWTNSSANAQLTGTPNPNIGNHWVRNGTDQPYYLTFFGYSPYSIKNIYFTNIFPSLNQLHYVPINVGESTSPAIVSNKSYKILQIFVGDPSSYGTITIDYSTGVVSTTSATKEGIYGIYIFNEGSYNITGLGLIVNGNAVPNAPICFPAGTLVLTDQGEVAIDKIDIKKNTIGGKEIIAITESIPLDNYLICIEKCTLSYNVPNRRTIISKDHKIMCNKNLIRAECLIEYIPTSYKVNYDKKKLYNVLLKEHSTMSVNNLIVETLNPKSAVAKIYAGNYTPKQRNDIIKAFNKYNQETRKKTVLSRNIFSR